MSDQYRIERDLIGELPVPQAAYYGIHTLRAKTNFAISGCAIHQHPYLINALAQVKHAAALANRDLGLLSAEKAAAIVKACVEVQEGRLHEQFVVDVYQGGAGTSTNMNANEVIANLALEMMGHAKGEYQQLHPNDDVNLGQSTNDVYPTALRLALYARSQDLLAVIERLRHAMTLKAQEYRNTLKVGRTQLQDAVPMTVGQEFQAHADLLGDDLEALKQIRQRLTSVNLGGTAIGTGIATHSFYPERVVSYLSCVSGTPLQKSANLIAATQDCGAFVALSSGIKQIALRLSKLANDLRLLASGPRAGIGEINLPPRQAGSSIMPGKVNPVLPEMLNQVAFQVVGNDLSVTLAAEAGQLQLNAFEPLIGHVLFQNIKLLEGGVSQFIELCINGITVNEAVLNRHIECSTAVVTALNPFIGYQQSTFVAKEVLSTGESVKTVVMRHALLPEAELDRILQPETITAPMAV